MPKKTVKKATKKEASKATKKEASKTASKTASKVNGEEKHFSNQQGNELLDDISSEIHDIWAHWMKYMMPKVRVKSIDDELRWKKQMKTKFNDLSDKEKQSDVDQAIKILNIIIKHARKISEKVK